MGAGPAQHRGRAQHGLHRELGGDRPGQPEPDPGVDHRLHDEEDIGRTGAGDGGDGILLGLRHPDHPSGGGHQRLDLGELLLAAAGPRRHRRHPLTHQCRGVRHHPGHRDPGGHPLLDEAGGDAGREGDQQLPVAQLRRDLVEQVCDVLRLHDEHHGVGAAHRLGVGDDSDGVLLLELARPLGALLADQHLGGRAARAQQRGQDRLAHHAGAEDGGGGHGSPWSSDLHRGRSSQAVRRRSVTAPRASPATA